MYQVGLTGGIGSGKTTVSKIFSILNVPVFNADEETKKLMNCNDDLKNKIIETFGSDSYINNVLNKTYISNIVFNDKYKLEVLNNIVHPITINFYNNWVQKQTSKYVIKEAALMFEAGTTTNLNFILGIFAPKHIRISRVINRDNLTKEQVENRIKNQIDDSIKMKLCDACIINNEQQLLIPQILQLHSYFLSEANK